MSDSWLSRLKKGLSRSSSKLTDGIAGLFNKRKLDDDALEDLEDLLITSDMGVNTSAKIVQGIAKTRFDKEISSEELCQALSEEIAPILDPVTVPLTPDPDKKPHVILMCGVNGSGKTTTIGKLAKLWSDQGLKVMMAAGDTFRAAAVEQLQVWGDRTGCTVIKKDIGSDAAALAFDALEQARAEGVDVLLIDTAGRLQNKAHLMEELKKVIRVIKKVDEATPHDTVLVLDSTVGQNAHSQVETFDQAVGVTGLIMTKLDGTAKGGVVVSLAEKYGKPVHAIGVGESAEDLRPFEAQTFARMLVGLE